MAKPSMTDKMATKLRQESVMIATHNIGTNSPLRSAEPRLRIDRFFADALQVVGEPCDGNSARRH